jgi:methyl-accepting chemotaxis protein/methyl-accepting chemotaxis protein-1 (serine sensor receptor)
MFKATDEATLSLSGSRSRAWTAVVIAFALVVGTLVAWLVHSINSSLRGMSRELGEGGQLVVEASSQMAASAQSMSQGAAEQAASLEETSASMEEIAAMTRTNADNSQQAAALMAEAARVLDQSNQSLADMVGAMSSIRESSNRVSKIIKTIDEIAFQTNILALNAAVEAARAGEAGMGFAVVADEVRNLAQRSAQAARDTTALIEGAIASSSEGSQRVSQAAESFAAITERVTEVKRLVDSVSVASGQQAHGIEQVLQGIRQMEKVTQTTAATAEESAAASEQLNAQAGTTMRLVERLEAMVGHDAARPEPPGRPVAPARTPSRIAVLAKAPRRARASEEAAAFPADGTYGQF